MMKLFFHKRALNQFRKVQTLMSSESATVRKEIEESSRSNFANRRKVMDFSSELKLLRSVYPSLVNEMLDEQLIYQDSPDVRKRYAKLIDYMTNLEDKYYSTALMTIRAYKLFEKPSLLTEKNLKLACILGWCFRFSESGMAIEDDIVDNSLYRYKKLTWHKLPNVIEPIAFLDATFFKSSVSYFLLNHFSSHPQYVHLHKHVIRNYATTGLSTTLEMIPCKVHEFEKYENVVKAYPLTYPVITTSMYLANIVDPDLHSVAKQFCMDFAVFLKEEDDFEGLYGKMDKDGTDAAQGQITWMAIQVVKHGTKAQIKTFEENYGKDDKESLSKIYSIYDDFNLKEKFEQHREDYYEEMYNRIKYFPKNLPQQPFLDMLDYGISGGIRS